MRLNKTNTVGSTTLHIMISLVQEAVKNVSHICCIPTGQRVVAERLCIPHAGKTIQTIALVAALQ